MVAEAHPSVAIVDSKRAASHLAFEEVPQQHQHCLPKPPNAGHHRRSGRLGPLGTEQGRLEHRYRQVLARRIRQHSCAGYLHRRMEFRMTLQATGEEEGADQHCDSSK